MRLAMMLVYVAILGSMTQVLAQDSRKGQISPYYYFIVASCPGKSLDITLNGGEKLSGKCHAPVADHFQITQKGVNHDIPYGSIAKVNIRRRWFGKLKDGVAVPYIFFKMAIGADELYPF